MNSQPHFSLIVGPLVIFLGLFSAVFVGWLAVNDPMALGITVLFFYFCYRAVKWLVL